MQNKTAATASYVFEGIIKSEQPLATCSASLAERKKGSATPVPSTLVGNSVRLMFPATGLRGKLRRACRDVVRNAVIAKTGNDKPFTLDQHYMLTLGGNKGEGETNRHSIALRHDILSKNPQVALFGAGDAGILGFVQGKVSIGNAVCINPCEKDIFSGVRTDDIYRSPEQIAYLTDEDVALLISRAVGTKDKSAIKKEVDNLKSELKAAKRAKDEDQVKAIESKIDALNQEVQDVKEKTGATDVSLGLPLSGFEAIPSGQDMQHRMILSNVTEVELGLFLSGISQFSLMPFVGAHFATGCGMISAEWEVRKIDSNGAVTLGFVRVEPFNPEITTSEVLQASVSAFNAFMDSGEGDFSIPAKAEKTRKGDNQQERTE